ncbi:MAG: hypothetical protein CEO40_160 [Parcubacteria group bacterium LiPW_72]|nr:MAG: hypothetical protein CEO40_160 [Parcubacteria group bacterium LiPW_72]
MIWLVLVLAVCFSGCYVGLSPVDESGFELKVKNETYGVENITIRIQGDFYYNGRHYSSAEFEVPYTETVTVEPKADQYVSVTYLVKAKKGNYSYNLHYYEEICIDPSGYLFELESPYSLDEYYGWS